MATKKRTYCYPWVHEISDSEILRQRDSWDRAVQARKDRAEGKGGPVYRLGDYEGDDGSVVLCWRKVK